MVPMMPDVENLVLFPQSLEVLEGGGEEMMQYVVSFSG